MGEPPVAVVGLHGGECFGAAAAQALDGAEVLIGSARHLDSVGPSGAERVELFGDLAALVDDVEARRRAGRRVCVLASGDPGFFGIVRLLSARLGAGALRVHPAPSSVSLAFARAGLSWDDAAVVSAHGRHPAAAVAALLRHPKVAVLCSPDAPPQHIGQLALGDGVGERSVVVASRLGEPGESVWRGDLAGLAAGSFDPLSVVLLLAPPPSGHPFERTGPAIRWGAPDPAFAHRGGMITKAEVRAVALGKLALPPVGVMWDVGAGSGSVAAESARLCPGLAVFAVEKGDTADLRANLAGTAARVVPGEAPAVLAGLPDPDRAFVGGGGLAVLDAVLSRLRPGGTVVATFASPARAAGAYERLGHMVQMRIDRAVAMPGAGGMRLAAENPVFVCWGPQE